VSEAAKDKLTTPICPCCRRALASGSGLCLPCRTYHEELRPEPSIELAGAESPLARARSDDRDKLTILMRNPKTGELEEVPSGTVVGFTEETCDCELRDRAWDPNRGRCMTCGRYFVDPRTGGSHPPG